MPMAELDRVEYLVGDALDQRFGHSAQRRRARAGRRTCRLPVPVRFELVENGAIAVLEHQVELVLPLGLEHFHQID